MVTPRATSGELSPGGRRGIGRIELVIVVFLAVAIFATIPPWILQKRSESRKQQAMQRFRNVGQAINTYHEIYRAYPQIQRP